MRFPPTWLTVGCWWTLAILLSIYVLFCRYKSYLSGKPSSFESKVFLTWVAVLLITVVPEINLFGVGFSRRDVSEKKTLKVSESPDVRLKPTPPEKVTPEVEKLTDMEKKILKTFWTKQVNRHDSWLKGRPWGFRIGSRDLEYFKWREAAVKLLHEGLISQSPKGLIYLTMRGYIYCKEHYKKFGEEEFWPQETIKEEMLKKVLGTG